MMRRLLATVGMASLMVGVPAVQAQCAVAITNPPSGSCTQNTNASLTVQAVARMTVSSFAGLGNPTVADYEVGYRDAAGPTITVKANVPWTITIRGTTSTWQSSDDPMSDEAARVDKPVGDLQAAVTVGGPFTSLVSSVGGVTLTTGSPTNESVINTFFRSLWDFGLDTPGSYTLTVTFTIVAN